MKRQMMRYFFTAMLISHGRRSCSAAKWMRTQLDAHEILGEPSYRAAPSSIVILTGE